MAPGCLLEERRLRYVAVFEQRFGQASACRYLSTWDLRGKAQ
jgi:hypothetical protein